MFKALCAIDLDRLLAIESIESSQLSHPSHAPHSMCLQARRLWNCQAICFTCQNLFTPSASKNGGGGTWHKTTNQQTTRDCFSQFRPPTFAQGGRAPKPPWAQCPRLRCRSPWPPRPLPARCGARRRRNRRRRQARAPFQGGSQFVFQSIWGDETSPRSFVSISKHMGLLFQHLRPEIFWTEIIGSMNRSRNRGSGIVRTHNMR